VVPFFGAAASAIYRPDGAAWKAGQPFMPFGGELARSLANAASYPVDDIYNTALEEVLAAIDQLGVKVDRDEATKVLEPVVRRHLSGVPNLALIASWAQHVAGDRKRVHGNLRNAFAVSAKPGFLHQQLAQIEGTRLYITTNYDDLLEQALEHRQPHVVIDRGDKGLWVSVGGQPLEPTSPTGDELYKKLNDPKTQAPSRPIIFKMHGSVDKVNAGNDSFLITEEDYVDFLGRAGGSYIPPYLMGLMQGKAFLFLGYSLEDWNVRVILSKLLKPGGVTCWAIVRGRSEREEEVWHARGLNVYSIDLSEFAAKLKDHL
jgi:hypothetical protein